MPMPSARAARGLGDVDRLAVPADLAGVGLHHAVDDLHQRRLAGAVLAEHRMDLARARREADVVVGEHAGEALGDAAQLQPRCDGGMRSAVPSVAAQSVLQRGLRCPRAASVAISSAAASAAITAGRLSAQGLAADRAGPAARAAAGRIPQLAEAALELGPLGGASRSGRDSAKSPRSSTARARARNRAHDCASARGRRCRPAPPRPRRPGARRASDLDAAGGSGGNSPRAAVDPADTERQRRQRAGQRLADMAGAEQQTCGRARRRGASRLRSVASTRLVGAPQRQRDAPAAALADCRAERDIELRPALRPPPSICRARAIACARAARRRSCRRWRRP